MTSGATYEYIVMPSAARSGFKRSSASNASVRKADGRFRMSACFPRKDSHCVWNSSMIEISTRPICGIALPRMVRTSSASRASPAIGSKSHVKPR